MPDRCEVLPGDSVVARRGGGLLWVDAPGSPALVAALHACLGCRRPRRRPGAGRRRRPGERRSPTAAPPSPSCSPTPSAAPAPASRCGPARASRPSTACRSPARRSRAAPSPPASPSARPCTSGPARPRRRCRRASPTTSSRAPCPAPARCCSSPPRPHRRSSRGAAGHRRARVAVHRRLGRRLRLRRGSPAQPVAPESGEQTAFWRPEQPAAPVLRFDDGMVVTVDEDLVLGRRPDNHEMVTSGGARPVPIADTQNVLSSAHAALQRAGREVSLIDLGSLNGTHVAGPEATEWTQLEPGVAAPAVRRRPPPARLDRHHLRAGPSNAPDRSDPSARHPPVTGPLVTVSSTASAACQKPRPPCVGVALDVRLASPEVRPQCVRRGRDACSSVTASASGSPNPMWNALGKRPVRRRRDQSGGSRRARTSPRARRRRAECPVDPGMLQRPAPERGGSMPCSGPTGGGAPGAAEDLSTQTQRPGISTGPGRRRRGGAPVAYSVESTSS